MDIKQLNRSHMYLSVALLSWLSLELNNLARLRHDQLFVLVGLWFNVFNEFAELTNIKYTLSHWSLLKFDFIRETGARKIKCKCTRQSTIPVVNPHRMTHRAVCPWDIVPDQRREFFSSSLNESTELSSARGLILSCGIWIDLYTTLSPRQVQLVKAFFILMHKRAKYRPNSCKSARLARKGRGHFSTTESSNHAPPLWHWRLSRFVNNNNHIKLKDKSERL